jgi:hypothetical protein
MLADEDQLIENVQGFVLILALCNYSNSIRVRHKITRSGILEPKMAPWEHLLNFGDEATFLNVTGFTRRSFMDLETLLFVGISGRKRGRPPSLDERGQLGLYLFYVGSSMGLKHLCLIFGTTPSATSRFILKVMKLASGKIMRNDTRSRVRYPKTDDEFQEMTALVNRREPSARNVFSFTDGLSLKTECNPEPLVQNAYYSGYHSDTMVNNVFMFSPMGKILLAIVNFPGSWPDSSLLNTAKETVLSNPDYSSCVDCGFKRTREYLGIFVGPYSAKQVTKLSPILKEALLARAEIMVSLRQSSEWGMRGLQGTFPRLKARLMSDSKVRGRLLMSIVYLHNFRVQTVGLNQICTVFNINYENHINICGYDRIRRYYDRMRDI